jgi:hypothetical protein
MLAVFPLFLVSVAAACDTTLLLFSDRAWLAATETLLGEWGALSRRNIVNESCAVLWLWWREEDRLPRICGINNLVCRVFPTVKSDEGGAQWGGGVYFAKIAQRLPAVVSELAMLGVNASRGLLMLDSDVVLRRNVGAWIRRDHRDAALVFQQEWPCQTAPQQLCVNGGVWWARQTLEAQVMLQEAISLMNRLQLPDQDALQIISKRHSGSVAFLDRRPYPNGHTAFFSDISVLQSAHLVHANWLKSIECKLETLARLRRREKLSLGLNCTFF